MRSENSPSATVRWWLDKRADLEMQLALAAKNTSLRQINRLKNSIKRIDALLATMEAGRSQIEDASRSPR